MKSPGFWLIAGLLVIGMAVARGCRSDYHEEAIYIEMGGERFAMEPAVSDAELRRGMAGREQVSADEGMLFIFRDEDIRQFWMYGCLIPLDIIFLDSAGRIVASHTMEPPRQGKEPHELPTYSSARPAQYAVEVKAGTIGRLGLNEGDVVDLPYRAIRHLLNKQP